MLPVFILLILALLIKDATPLGDRFILRALSEGTALLVGGGWLLLSGFRDFTWRHATLVVYLGVLVMAIPLAENPMYVGLQVLALVGVVTFSVAFFSHAARDRRLTDYAVRTMFVALTVVCLSSFVLRFWYPNLTYEQTFEGPRFRGFFSKPAMMGAASGLLLGLSLFVPWNWGMKGAGIVASLPCLFLTGSRTFWVAASASMVIASFRYVSWRKWLTVSVAVLMVAVVCVGLVVGSQVTSEQRAKIFRQDSIESLSGRTSLWAEGLQRFWEHPWLGNGFTAGGTVFTERSWRGMGGELSKSQTERAATLHSGYVQALLDSGGIGAALYMAVIISALLCFLRYDGGKQYAAEFYCLLFLAIANLSETIISGAAVLHQVWFWYVTVLAFSLPSLARGLPVSSGRAGHCLRGTRLDDQIGLMPPPGPQEPRRFSVVQSKEACL